MQVIALYNSKGGVGKTSATVNLAYLAARDGARVLLWDLDPQGAASYCLRIKPKIKGGGKRLLKNDLADRIKFTDYPSLDLLPADFSYRNLDRVLDDAKKPERGLHKRLKDLSDDYDYVFLDCPPSISLLSESIFYAARRLLVPIIPAILSLRTLEQLAAFSADERFRDVEVIPFVSMLDRRRRLHREFLERIPRDWPNALDTAIPYASEVERMASERTPLAVFAPRSRAARAYTDLWRELGERL
jgi:chromosome partitioning protein